MCASETSTSYWSQAWDPCSSAGQTEGPCQVLKESRNVRVLVNLKSAVCDPALVNSYLYDGERRKAGGGYLSFV